MIGRRGTEPHRDDQGRRLHRSDYRPGRLVCVGGRCLERHRREAPLPGWQAAYRL